MVSYRHWPRTWCEEAGAQRMGSEISPLQAEPPGIGLDDLPYGLGSEALGNESAALRTGRNSGPSEISNGRVNPRPLSS